VTGRVGALAALFLAISAAALAIVFWPAEPPAPAAGPESVEPASSTAPPPVSDAIPGASDERPEAALDDDRSASESSHDEEPERLACIEETVRHYDSTGGNRWLGGNGRWARFEALEQSTDPDHLFAAMHLAHRDAERFWQLYERAERLLPDDDRRVFLGALQCANTDSASCPPGFFADQLNRDQANGALWLLAASHELTIGDRNTAMAHMNVAASLDSFDDYVAESADAIYRSLGVATVRSHIERATAGITVAADTISSAGARVAIACGRRALANPEWMDQCEALGRNLIRQRQSLVFHKLGSTVLKSLARVSGEEKRAELLALADQSTDALESLVEPMESTVELMVVDEALFARFIDLNRELGGYEALRAYEKEARALIADPDYRPCEGVAVPVN